MSSYGSDFHAKNISASDVCTMAHLVTAGLSLGAAATTPASGKKVGEVWFVAGNTSGSADTENGVHIWNGSAWVHVSPGPGGA